MCVCGCGCAAGPPRRVAFVCMVLNADHAQQGGACELEAPGLCTGLLRRTPPRAPVSLHLGLISSVGLSREPQASHCRHGQWAAE